ncbi:hypothetical protein LEP1GSC034_3345 [Leptospira interrogans str. 2003000735]|uniref:Uncharacterized protein n=3 Tax=Leptospira interrogans TaxID=173 RepID=A0AAQ1SPE8_LEPIR|nr:hypothetical protein LEP1GSC027_3894 [Leptospira interrogans str. 2002000624]EKQ35883.1 hypothetical protein LEP1GSC025_2363 [Leptospira interrogans str. 2002000621]EKQ46053.1 hypothetical protein LEP1GSC026_3089 [Leptospira interrogans str. 2002000623]EMJ58291.1 hypothetical protein LEP1GSC013_2044 [Leptospira interrogans serovar Valbuzzi str. Duyster]EMJ66493.1 hypothetical protein LEP1GSC034_3345 [Leptospira interrogans str. 2003000735]EMJ72741.1 hypothetical protein LEP1GSC033_2873 [Lep
MLIGTREFFNNSYIILSKDKTCLPLSIQKFSEKVVYLKYIQIILF